MPLLLDSPAIIKRSVIPTIVTGGGEHLPLKPLCASRQATTAMVYCEGNFAATDGKTANGLVRHSGQYRILSVIDSEKSGLDSRTVLNDKPNNIPIFKGLAIGYSRVENIKALRLAGNNVLF